MTTKQDIQDTSKQARHLSGPPRASVGSSDASPQIAPEPFVVRKAETANTAGVQISAVFLLILAAGAIIAPGASTVFQGSIASIAAGLLPSIVLVVAAIGLFGFQLWGWWAGTTLLYTFGMIAGFGIIGHVAGLHNINLMILSPMVIVCGVAVRYLSSDSVIQPFIQKQGLAASPKKVGPAMLGAGLTFLIMVASRFL